MSWTFWCVDRIHDVRFHISATKNHERKGFTYFTVMSYLMSFLCHFNLWKNYAFTPRKANKYPPEWGRHPKNMASCQVRLCSFSERVKSLPQKKGSLRGSPKTVWVPCKALYIMKQNSRGASHKTYSFNGRSLSSRPWNHLGFGLFFFKTWSKTAKGISALVCFATWSLKV